MEISLLKNSIEDSNQLIPKSESNDYIRLGLIDSEIMQSANSFELEKYDIFAGDINIGKVFFFFKIDCVYISIYILKKNYCYRMPNSIIKLAVNTIVDNYPYVKSIYANVNRKSISSLYYFLKSGFKKCDPGLVLDLNDCSISKKVNDIIAFENKDVSVLFLTNNPNSLGLFEWICERTEAEIFSGKLSVELLNSLNPKLVISYNYIHIVSRDCIDVVDGKIVNMHVSLLPWNRGASPNSWSFIEDTPKGVTIHVMTEELDRGDILYQKELHFDPQFETFETTYKKLNEEICNLFKDHWNDFVSGEYLKYRHPQVGKGSYHSLADLDSFAEKYPFEWSDNIGEFLSKYNNNYNK